MIVTLYKKTISRVLIFVACLLIGQLAIGQQYPVQIVPQLLPPYTLNVSDYYNGTSEKLVVLLTNNDLNKPSLQVRLRMSIQGQTAKLISRDNIFYPAINLDAGVPTRISLSDLAPYFNADNLIFEGITRAQYVQSSKLPEGFYQFCFEAIEINSNQVVGRSSCAMAWISLSDPPLLNLPRKAESVVYKDPQNIIFQWTPRNYNSPTSAFNTEYEFSLVEIWDNGLAPEAAFGNGQPLYRTTTQSTTLLYGPGEPLLLSGRKYAWRVRAQMANGSGVSDTWRNNGYSEIYWFNCQSNCAAPLNVQHEISSGRATITWTSNPNQTSFTVDYREKGQDGATWYNSVTTASRMMLYDLKKDKTYEYRVGGTCDNGITYTYSDIKTLVMDGTSANNGDCGMLVAEENISNQTPIQTLLTGDVITAGDFPVKLLQVSGQGSFTGAGYVTVPFLGQNRVKVKFTGITVNTDKQLLAGVIESTYDAKETQIANFDKVIDGGDGVGIVTTGLDTAGYYVDMVIPDANSIDVELTNTVDSAGNTVPTGGATLTVTGNDGTVKKVEVEQLPATIKDKNGTIYGVDKDGHVTKIASSETMNMTAAELNTLQPDKAIVKFIPHEKQQYAFDEYQPLYSHSNLFNEEYEKLNGNYYVNGKAIAEAKADVVKAVAEIKDKSISADSIRFVTAKGTRYESIRLPDSTWEIKLVGGPGGDAQELYALYPKGGGKYLSLGKLFIASYPARTYKLVLVPVNGASVNKDEISKQLNLIYNPIAISLQVTQEPSFNDKSWDLNHDEKLAVSGSGWLSTLTGEMKALNNAYVSAHTVQQDAVYLFVLNSSDSTLAGDMPRGKQFGYLFTGADGKAAAHEVGHGLFKLSHVFDGYGFKQGELPSNVMDYPAGDRFAKHQWNLLHSPGVVIGIFEKEGDGQLTITRADAFKDLKNANTNTYTFLSPGGLPVTLPATATDIVLSETNYFTTKEDSKYLHTTPFGTLVSFKLKNGDQTELYTALGSTSARTFAQYQCAACDGNRGKAYVDNLTAKETGGNVILAFPCFSVPSNYGDNLSFEVNAYWFQPGDDAFTVAKTNQNYGAGGKFSDAEKILEKAALDNFPNDRKPVYTISQSISPYSDFQNSKRASTFIADNTSCKLMPLPVIMNMANLIKLNEAGYEAWVQCKKQGEKPSNYVEPYDERLDTKEEAEAYLAAFQDYLKTSKEGLKLAAITKSGDMETKLANMCWTNYSSLTSAERIQILKVLTQESNISIGGCLVKHKLKCEEGQLIEVIKTIPDQKQAQEVADFLNKNQGVLLRLIRDVNDDEDGVNNHEEMMKALFDLCELKEVQKALSAADLVGPRLHYNAKFDYGAFSITSKINRVDFGENGGVKFFIELQKAQVFSSNIPSEVKQKYAVQLENNGYSWINPNPLDAVTIVFGEDFKLTNGDVVFAKGDIVRIPALYFWNLYQIDAQQTAALLKGNLVKLAINGAALISMGVAEGATAKVFATLDFASSAYATIVSPTLLRQNLSPQVKEIVEGFDEIGQIYMMYRLGEGAVGLGQLIKNYRVAYLEKIQLAKASANAAEKPIVEKIENVVNSVEAETGGGQAATDPASSGNRPTTQGPSTTQGQSTTQNPAGQTNTQNQAPGQGTTGTSGQPSTQGPSTTQGQTGTQVRTGSDNQPATQNTSTSGESTSGRPAGTGGQTGNTSSFTSKLKNTNLASALQQDLNANAAFKQLITDNEELVEAWEVLETAGYSSLRTDANELKKIAKLIKDNNLTLDAAVAARKAIGSWKWLPEGALPKAAELKLGTGGTINYHSTRLSGLTFENQVTILTENVSGLTKEQAEYLLNMAKEKNIRIAFGGSRVRGNATAISDLDVGFDGVTQKQLYDIADKYNKTFFGSSRSTAPGAIKDKFIFTGKSTDNIPEILNPEEFFMRSGNRYYLDKGGAEYFPSGFISVDGVGNVHLGKP